MGVRNRILTLSGGQQSSLAKLYYRYEMANTHPVTMNLFKRMQVDSSSQTKRKTDNTATMVLRYHPVFRLALSRALSLVPVPAEIGLPLRIGWANALPSMDSLVNSHNKKWEHCSHQG